MKNTRNERIYLPEYFTGRMAESFDLEKDKDILSWDFSADISETVKYQVEWILCHIAKHIKNREERRNQYLLPLKFLFQYAEEAKLLDVLRMEKVQEVECTAWLKLKIGRCCGSPGKFLEFCRKEFFLKEKESAWHANVWYVDGLNINPERQAKGSVIQRFSFLDIVVPESRAALQEYTKYLFRITGQSVGTIRIQHTYVREFMRYLEENDIAVSHISYQTVKRYLEHLRTQRIKPQSCNNKIQGTIKFISYLQVKGLVCYFEIPSAHFLKKAYPVRNEIRGLDGKIEQLEGKLYLFPEDLRMSYIGL